MNAGFYSGVSGMIAFQKEMDVTANNIANVNTTGFKPMNVSFGDLLYTEMDTHASESVMTGHGVMASGNRWSMTAGLYEQTGQSLDFAIHGDGFFAIEQGDGEKVYTRNGAFKIGIDKNKSYLTTAEGNFVLNASGKKIELKAHEESNLPDLSALKDNIGIYTFSNPYGLTATDHGCFQETELSGKAEAMRSGKSKKGSEQPLLLMQGTLENSAVDLTDEMVRVIQSQRAFQLNAKIVQVSDQIEDIINSLR